MKKVRLILLFCFLLINSSIFARITGSVIPPVIGNDSSPAFLPDSVQKDAQGSVKGKVIDEKTREPIIGATVLYDNNAGGTITDTNGRYELKLTIGQHQLEFRFLGYDTTIAKVKINAHREIVEDIALGKADKELGLVTVTGSKYAKKFGEDAVSVEVLRPEFIEHSNDVSLDKALDKVPGVTMVGEQVNIRGGAGYSDGAANRVLVLMDDLPLLTPDDGSIEFKSLPLENVEQIEVIKGAASALYGSSALDGIINVRTANPKAEPFTKITLYWGFYENPFSGVEKQTYWDPHRPMFGGASFSHRKKYKNLDIVIGGAYNQDKSYLAKNASTSARLNIKLRYHCPKVPGLTFGVNVNASNTEGGYFFLWKGWGKTVSDSVGKKGYHAPDSLAYLPSAPGTIRNTPINMDPFITYFDNRGNMHSFKARIYYVSSEEQDTFGGHQQSNAVLYYGEYNFHRDLKKIGVNLVAGTAASYSNVNSLTFGNRHQENGAVFLQLDKKFFDRLTLSLGARAEINRLDTAKPAPVPVARAGLNYQATESTFLRASFGQGYRYPTIGEKDVQTLRSGAYVYPNPTLKPESGWSAELGIKQAVKAGKNWIAYFDLAGFVSQYHNLIEYDIDTAIKNQFAFQAQNVTNARISGLDISSLGQGKLFGYPFSFMVGYTFLVPIDLDWKKGVSPNPTNILNYRSRHAAKADIESTVKHVVMGVTATYVSFMDNIESLVAADNNIGDFRKANQNGSFVMDARVGYSLSEGTRVSFIAKNVLNAQYSLRPGLMEAPRNYTVQLSYQF